MCRLVPFLLASATLAAAGPPIASGNDSLLGHWTLVEQRYGEGGHDFAQEDGEIIVAFSVDQGRLSGRVTWRHGRAAWPAYPTPDGPAPVEGVSRAAAPDLSWAEARYRVPAPEPDGTALLVHERWELTDSDRAECRLRITFERRGETRGSFVWNRVFAREPGP
jgi:hypothetical protein